MNMKILRHLSLLKKERRPIVLAIGFFDGVHGGHKKVIRHTISRARVRHGKAWALTFDPHPLKVLSPTGAPPLLTSTQHKLELLSRLRLDGCVVMPFTHRLAGLPPKDFVELLTACTPPLAEIVVGRNWRFGRHGHGTPALLSRLCRDRQIVVHVVPPVKKAGGPISSTRIRKEIMRGNLRKTEALMGRPFSVLGTVIHGRGVGRRIGFPTANLDPHGEALPPFGVYAVRARLGRQWMKGVLSIGVRPTFPHRGKAKPSFELHLPGLHRQLYGTDIEVLFVSKIRDERRFPTIDALKRQIAQDILQAGTGKARRT
jgi:riboflavin kinase/FMN adenylyltransferase